MSMSKQKRKKKWGGSRTGAGRPKGEDKAKICISVERKLWQDALSKWRKGPSALVENLLSEYVGVGPGDGADG